MMLTWGRLPQRAQGYQTTSASDTVIIKLHASLDQGPEELWNCLLQQRLQRNERALYLEVIRRAARHECDLLQPAELWLGGQNTNELGPAERA